MSHSWGKLSATHLLNFYLTGKLYCFYFIPGGGGIMGEKLMRRSETDGSTLEQSRKQPILKFRISVQCEYNTGKPLQRQLPPVTMINNDIFSIYLIIYN